MSQQQASIEELQEELGRIDGLIEAAAVAEDAEAFVRLQMRRVALSYHIREAKATPIRAEIERLVEEREALEEEEQRVREAPLPEVPAQLRGHQTPAALKQAALGDISRRGIEVGKALQRRRHELVCIEAASPAKAQE